MNQRALMVLGLLAAALWLLARRSAAASGAGGGGGQGNNSVPIVVHSVGPTINENLEVDDIITALRGPYGQPYRVSVTTPDYILRYQHLMPFDPYDSPVLNPLRVIRP
jgi:hypothetical protein